MLLPLLLIFILAGDNVFTQNTTEVDQENSEVDEYEELTMMKGMNTIFDGNKHAKQCNA